ncbi:MAG TPA: anti-sigma factor [Acidimicrobiia bacterium]
MNTDDRSAGYLADWEGHPSGQSEKLDATRAILREPKTWADPPADVEANVIASIRDESVKTVDTSWRGWVPRLAGVAAVTLIAVALMAIWPTGTRIDLIGTEAMPQAAGVATLDATDSGWSIGVSLTDLPPAEPGTYYEGWVWSDEGEGVSIGTFHLRGGNDPVTLWAGVDVNDYPSIWISVQTEGAGNEVSDQIVMRGRLTDPDE